MSPLPSASPGRAADEWRALGAETGPTVRSASWQRRRSARLMRRRFRGVRMSCAMVETSLWVWSSCSGPRGSERWDRRMGVTRSGLSGRAEAGCRSEWGAWMNGSESGDRPDRVRPVTDQGGRGRQLKAPTHASGPATREALSRCWRSRGSIRTEVRSSRSTSRRAGRPSGDQSAYGHTSSAIRGGPVEGYMAVAAHQRHTDRLPEAPASGAPGPAERASRRRGVEPDRMPGCARPVRCEALHRSSGRR